ncbi:pentatricopeptide repeat-containing protein At2g13600 isoform X1 [Cannabis sativa]|uniref:pentatricopeptide repeat-containing protein At2g13600 isoform X1 n=1 Tax=Cannabis sativa TaxID=3483 RepID=UPI0029CA8E98|nr:pentatricopeptide repeat-containing protein At2g13600 isoform X1 [Cannabis sativa]
MDIPSTRVFQNLSLLPINQFQTSEQKDWNLMIKHHTKSNNDQAILTTYTHMESLGISPNKATLPLVLKACARLKAVEKGRKVHFRIRGTSLIRDIRVGTAIVDFYGKCGLVDDAREVFDQMGVKDIVLWNAMIYGYVGCCSFEKAIKLFMEMQKEGLKPNSRTIVGLLSACREVYKLRLGQEIHGYCLRNGLFDLDAHVGTALIGFYLRFDVEISRYVFDLMVVRNIVSWNAIITGYLDMEEYLEACSLFVLLLVEGFEFDSITLVAVVQASAQLGSLKLGAQIHQIAIKSGYKNDVFIVNALLNMYSDCGSLDSSCRLFENVSKRDVALWNSMMKAYLEYGIYDEAVSLFTAMKMEGIREDKRTIAILLSSCSSLADGTRFGKSLHAHVIKTKMEIDTSLGNALLSMYAELNCVKAAQNVFKEMIGPAVVSWNTSIMALACNRLRGEAWNLFEAMRALKIELNSHTIISIMAACDDEIYLNIGRAIHGFVIKLGIEIDLSLNTALTDMYMNCGDEATAMNLFESYPNKDVISWNAIIASLVKNNQGEKAHLLFSHMISEVEPNDVTIINMLSSFTHLAALTRGQCFHAYATRRQFSFDNNLSLANAFVTMYARCGSMQNAEKVFKILPRRNIVTWNALIAGYATHGRGHDAIQALLKMIEDGLSPNAATFTAVLSACRHCGFVEKGLLLFHTMVHDFKINPELVHYGCVVDLLCRGGRLNEAREFIESMPIEPDASLWRALLSACRLNSNIKLAANIFDKLVELEPMNAGNYILLSNIYAAAGLWLEVRKIRLLLQEKGLKKSPGLSWIVVQNQVHSFSAGDTSHPLSEKIYANLCSLTNLIRESGYTPDFGWVLYEEEED